MARRKVVYAADGKDAATVKEFADFLEAHGGKREAVTDASIDMGPAFEAGIKANFENAEITFDKFHVIKLANEAVDEVRRQEARNNFQIKGRRYIFLKNVDHLTQEEKEALSRLEAQNLDTIQAMQIRMNLQQLFTMDAKTARRFLDRWNAWVQVCDLGPMKRLAKTIMGKAEGRIFEVNRIAPPPSRRDRGPSASEPPPARSQSESREPDHAHDELRVGGHPEARARCSPPEMSRTPPLPPGQSADARPLARFR